MRASALRFHGLVIRPVASPDPTVEVLLVEDNPGDVELVGIAFSEAGLLNPLRVVTDGEQAIAYLRRKPPFERVQHPGLILLDLNLPGKDGREVLKTLKSDPDLKQIPVCILTTSDEPKDLVACYRLHANSYIQKPTAIADLIDVAKQIKQYWLHVVQLPPVRSTPSAKSAD